MELLKDRFAASVLDAFRAVVRRESDHLEDLMSVRFDGVGHRFDGVDQRLTALDGDMTIVKQPIVNHPAA
ncbi:MAG: hypothetical protein QM572_15685 [Nocardioides sp.]|uniref:hypothetical protein n=1 Tax=Nocardioides sp. TaxID=35761 RepID=UPI0039E611DA